MHTYHPRPHRRGGREHIPRRWGPGRPRPPQQQHTTHTETGESAAGGRAGAEGKKKRTEAIGSGKEGAEAEHGDKLANNKGDPPPRRLLDLPRPRRGVYPGKWERGLWGRGCRKAVRGSVVLQRALPQQPPYHFLRGGGRSRRGGGPLLAGPTHSGGEQHRPHRCAV